MSRCFYVMLIFIYSIKLFESIWFFFCVCVDAWVTQESRMQPTDPHSILNPPADSCLCDLLQRWRMCERLKVSWIINACLWKRLIALLQQEERWTEEKVAVNDTRTRLQHYCWLFTITLFCRGWVSSCVCNSWCQQVHFSLSWYKLSTFKGDMPRMQQVLAL